MAVWLALDLMQAAWTGLARDEVYYWYIAQVPAWGYFDHPPMAMWLVRLGTWLGGGDGSLWIRLGSVVLMPLSLGIFWMLVRTPKSTWRSALCYSLAAFAMPLLQAYGVAATPDAPLLFFTVVTLWAYRYYLRTVDIPAVSFWRVLLSVGLLAVGFAGLGYAKYYGALVVLFIVLSNGSLLRRRSFWVVVGLALFLYLPHLWWQYTHDWVSLRYHLSERNGVFAWWHVGEYLRNLLLTFHPLLFPVFLIYLFRMRAEEGMERALKFVAWGFLLFFGAMTLRGQIQPQWLLPMVLPMLWLLCRQAEARPTAEKYLMRVGWVTAVLFVGVRVFAMVYTGDRVPLDIFTNRKAALTLHEEVGGRPVIFEGDYAAAAGYTYYTGAAAYALPSIYTRSSQYAFIDGDTPLYGRPVAVGVARPVADSLRRVGIGVSGGAYFDTVGFYIPTRRVEVVPVPALPRKALTGQSLPVMLEVRNPYPFDIPLGGGEGFGLLVSFRSEGRVFYDRLLKVDGAVKAIPAGDTLYIRTQVPVPERVPDGKYRVGFTLQRYPFGSAYNGGPVNMQLVNPRTKL